MHFNTEAYKKLFPRQEKPKFDKRYEEAVEDDTEMKPKKKAAESVIEPVEENEFSPEEDEPAEGEEADG